jgi:hypothetical protein
MGQWPLAASQYTPLPTQLGCALIQLYHPLACRQPAPQRLKLRHHLRNCGQNNANSIQGWMDGFFLLKKVNWGPVAIDLRSSKT